MINTIILLSIICSSSAQLFLKIGMTNFALQNDNRAMDATSVLAGIVLNPYILGGVSLHLAALATWLYVLKHVEVSYAYPFISLGFVLVLIFGYLFFDETLNFVKCLGIAAIILGVFLISRS